MAAAGGDDAPLETVDTAATELLLKWIRGKVEPKKQPKGNLSAFIDTFEDINNQYVYDLTPAQVQGYFMPVLKGSLLTTEPELGPINFHLQGTTVYVFSPFHYKAALACGDKVCCSNTCMTCMHAYMLRLCQCVLCMQIPCPACNAAASANGGNLKSDGFAPKLRRVMGMSRTQYLLYSKLRCTHPACGRE
jgi:hypothetical protein